jgi:hypothetical protein
MQASSLVRFYSVGPHASSPSRVNGEDMVKLGLQLNMELDEFTIAIVRQS